MSHEAGTRNPRPLIDHFEGLRLYSFPFTAANPLMLVPFTLLYSWIEFGSRLLGLVGVVVMVYLTYTTTVFFLGYMLIVLRYTALGYQRVPGLSYQLIYDAKVPLFKVAVLACVLLSVVYLVTAPWWRLFVAMCLLPVLPVAISINAIENNLLGALNPLRWYHMLARLESRRRFVECLLLELAVALAAIVVVAVDLGWLNIVKVACILLLITLAFRVFGILLNDNAEALGFNVVYGKQVEAAQLVAAETGEIADFMFDLYKLVEGGKGGQAWTMLESALEAGNYRNEGAYFEHARHWDDPSLAIRAGQGYIQRLVARGDPGRAWEVLEFCYSANGNEYRLTSGSTAFALASRADTRQRKQIMFHLFSHFDDDFPNHPRLAEALLSAAMLAARDLDDFDAAREILARIRRTCPSITGDGRFVSLAAVLDAPG